MDSILIRNSFINILKSEISKSYSVKVSFFQKENNWGEPERAPHKREVRAVSLSVCLSVRTFMTRKIYKNSTNLRVPSVVDCSV